MASLNSLFARQCDNSISQINPELLQQHFRSTRMLSTQLTQAMSAEDQMLQSMPDASPTKWHLAHTTWFFDTFLLAPRSASVQPDTSYTQLFNSYYNGVGPQHLRAHRGLLSRPSLCQIWHYRHAVEEKMEALWQEFNTQELALIELGINHEQQHQELIVTDIKHALSFNPQHPALVAAADKKIAHNGIKLHWHEYAAGEYSLGSREEDFCFDNETPRHPIYLSGFRLANRPATNEEYLAFMADGGYGNFAHWLSEGWAWVQATKAEAPLYWYQRDGEWWTYTLAGAKPVDLREPVCHINYYEASAFASWCGKRLPTEAEWEIAAGTTRLTGEFLNTRKLHPQPAAHSAQDSPLQMFGDVWEWTQSAYLPYPGFKTRAGAIGEYNGKFMVNQWVLRGGSCATPEGHIRPGYRNFFPVNASWQFSGVRLADDPS